MGGVPQRATDEERLTVEFWINETAVVAVSACVAVIVVVKGLVRIFARRGDDA